ncbi:MAG: plasmid stabilization protein [Robiginitomaculum sp.]|nr:MAG: plasmid stabilization protein [Robiginitomaculum sp.]
MPETFEVLFSSEAERDFEFLFESYLVFDQDEDMALQKAEEKTQTIRLDAEKLAQFPYRGTLHESILPGLRNISFGRAILWFDILEQDQQVRVLAIFFGGQDNQNKMLLRLLG